MKKIDTTRPLKTRDDKPVQILEIYNQPILLGGRQIAGMYQLNTGQWEVDMWYLNGSSRKTETKEDHDLVNTNVDELNEPIEEKTPEIRDRSIIMCRKILSGEAVDLSYAKRVGGLYVVDAFNKDMDYCVLDLGQWIWSIGQRKSDGKILASLKVDMYENREYKCLWLR
jgi:hypothetical protein